jgi:predicted nucleotidyltransferase
MANTDVHISPLRTIQKLVNKSERKTPTVQLKSKLFSTTSTTQLNPIKKPWKQNRKRFINPARRKPGVKKARWLQLLESKGDLIERSGLSIQETLLLEKHLKKKGQELLLDNYLQLADIKELRFDELMAMVIKARSTLDRRYPYPFSNIEQFNKFKRSIRRLAGVLQINYTDIRVQGSALRKTDPHDLDIGIMVTQTELDRLKAIFDTRMARLNIQGRGRKQIDRAYQNGKFSPRDLAILGEEVTGQLVRIFELAAIALANSVGSGNAIPVQASVILIGGSLDSKPYMSF